MLAADSLFFWFQHFYLFIHGSHEFYLPCFRPRAFCVVPSVSERARESPIAAPGVKSLNFLPIRSGVITFRSPRFFVTIERTGTKSFSLGFPVYFSGYAFPLGAILPRALYLGINRPWFSVSSPS